MAYPQEIKDKVRGSYVYDRLALEDAARAHGIPYNTARTWKKKAKDRGDNWDRARQATRMVNDDITAAVMEDFVLLFQSTMTSLKEAQDMPALQKAEILAKLSDSYVKTMKAAGGGDPKMGKLAIALDVLNMLSEFIRKHYPEQVVPFTELLEPFGAHLSLELDA